MFISSLQVSRILALTRVF